MAEKEKSQQQQQQKRHVHEWQTRNTELNTRVSEFEAAATRATLEKQKAESSLAEYRLIFLLLYSCGFGCFLLCSFVCCWDFVFLIFCLQYFIFFAAECCCC